MDIVDISFRIFNSLPQDPCTIQLDFSDPGINVDYPLVFEQLIILFTQGMKILYGDSQGKVDLTQLEEKHFSKMKEYFKSFGFDVFYKIKNLNEENIAETTDKKESLSDYFLNLKTVQCIYMIYFDFYINPTTCKEIL